MNYLLNYFRNTAQLTFLTPKIHTSNRSDQDLVRHTCPFSLASCFFKCQTRNGTGIVPGAGSISDFMEVQRLIFTYELPFDDSTTFPKASSYSSLFHETRWMERPIQRYDMCPYSTYIRRKLYGGLYLLILHFGYLPISWVIL